MMESFEKFTMNTAFLVAPPWVPSKWCPANSGLQFNFLRQN